MENNEKFILDFKVNDKELNKFTKDLNNLLKTTKKDINEVSKDFSYFFNNSNLKDFDKTLEKTIKNTEEISRNLENATDVDISTIREFESNLKEIQNASEQVKAELELLEVDTTGIDALVTGLNEVNNTSLNGVVNQVEEISNITNKDFNLNFKALGISEITENVVNLLNEIDSKFGAKVRETLAFDSDNLKTVESAITNVAQTLQKSQEESKALIKELNDGTATIWEDTAAYITMMTNAGFEPTAAILNDIGELGHISGETTEDLTKLYIQFKQFTDLDDDSIFQYADSFSRAHVDLKQLSKDFPEFADKVKNAGVSMDDAFSELLVISGKSGTDRKGFSSYLDYLDGIIDRNEVISEKAKEGKKATKEELDVFSDTAKRTEKILQDNKEITKEKKAQLKALEGMAYTYVEEMDSKKDADAATHIQNLKEEASLALSDFQTKINEIVLKLVEDGKFEIIIESLVDLFDNFAGVMDKLADFITNMDDETFKGFVDAIIDLSFAAPLLLTAIGILGQLGAVFSFLGGINIAGFFSGLASSPIMLFIGKIALIGGLLFTLWQELKNTWDGFNKLFDAMDKATEGMGIFEKAAFYVKEMIGLTIGSVFDLIKAFLELSPLMSLGKSISKVVGLTKGNKSNGIVNNNNKNINVNNYNTINTNFDSKRFNLDMTRNLIF